MPLHDGNWPLIAASAIPLAMLFAFTGMRQAGIAGTLYRRHLFTRGVEEARDGSNVRAPFLMFPWRREGQLLIEREAYLFRSRDNKKLRAHLIPLVNDEAFRRAALSPRSAYQRDARDDDRMVSDPAIWYASLLLESGQADARKRVLNILRDRKEDEAVIQRMMIELNQSKGDDGVAARLEDALENRTKGKMKYSFLYQQGWEGLAAAAILRANQRRIKCGPQCPESDRIAMERDLDAAASDFQRVLDVRAEALSSEDTRWLRPPQKLTAYQLLHPAPGKASAATKMARPLPGCSCYFFSSGWPKRAAAAMRPTSWPSITTGTSSPAR